MSQSSCFLPFPPETHLQPPEQMSEESLDNQFNDWSSSNNIVESINTPQMILDSTMDNAVVPNSIWLLVVKTILLILSIHSLFAVCLRIIRVLHQFTRFGRKLNCNQDERTNEMKPSSTVNQLNLKDLPEVRLISLSILSISLLVSLLQIAVVYFDHFASICCSTAFALIALIGDFKSKRDPNGQLNLVICLISKIMFGFLSILKISNSYMYESRPRRRFSLQHRRPMNTYTVGR